MQVKPNSRYKLRNLRRCVSEPSPQLNPCGWRAHQGAHAGQQVSNQRKVAEVVSADLHLKSVLCVLQQAHHDARVQDLRAFVTLVKKFGIPFS